MISSPPTPPTPSCTIFSVWHWESRFGPSEQNRRWLSVVACPHGQSPFQGPSIPTPLIAPRPRVDRNRGWKKKKATDGVEGFLERCIPLDIAHLVLDASIFSRCQIFQPCTKGRWTRSMTWDWPCSLISTISIYSQLQVRTFMFHHFRLVFALTSFIFIAFFKSRFLHTSTRESAVS